MVRTHYNNLSIQYDEHCTNCFKITAKNENPKKLGWHNPSCVEKQI